MGRILNLLREEKKSINVITIHLTFKRRLLEHEVIAFKLKENL